MPGPATVELQFDHVDLHASDVLEVNSGSSSKMLKLFLAKVRDGLTEDSAYITSVKGPSVPTIRSLTGALHISFRSPFL